MVVFIWDRFIGSHTPFFCPHKADSIQSIRHYHRHHIQSFQPCPLQPPRLLPSPTCVTTIGLKLVSLPPPSPLQSILSILARKILLKFIQIMLLLCSNLPNGFSCHSELIFNTPKNIKIKSKVKTLTHSKAGHNLLPHSSEKLLILFLHLLLVHFAYSVPVTLTYLLCLWIQCDSLISEKNKNLKSSVMALINKMNCIPTRRLFSKDTLKFKWNLD